MPLIVVMEDDAGTRTLVTSVLKKDGHEVVAAADGAEGLKMVEQRRPSLVISDVQMPGLNGFQMVAALRDNPAIAGTPVILLTSLQERAHVRIGMNTGADDYITKPFKPAELREAVSAQLNRRMVRANIESIAVETAVETALSHQKHQLSKLYEKKLANELSGRWPGGEGGAGDERFESATVLFADIPNYGAVSEKLGAQDLAEVVKKFYGSAGDTVHLFGARHMQFIGEGLLAVFAGSSDTHSVSHGLRAARAALGLVESAGGMRQYMRTQFADRDLPRFEVSVALHSGPVTLTLLQDPLHGTAPQVLPVGDAVSATMMLQKRGQAMGWPITASAVVLRGISSGVKTGRRALVELPGRTAPLDAAELTGLAT